MKVNPKDWHYRIVHFPYIQIDGNISSYKECNDFCAYTRWFLVKLLISIPSCCVVIGAMIGEYIGGLLGFLSTGIFMFNNLFGVITTLLLLLGSLGLLVVIYDELEQQRIMKEFLKAEQGIIKEPGFFSVWYTKWKEKYCPTIHYTGK